MDKYADEENLNFEESCSGTDLPHSYYRWVAQMLVERYRQHKNKPQQDHEIYLQN